MSQILDAIQQKLNTAAAVSARTEQKVDREAATARDAEAALAARLTALEGEFTDARAAFELAQTQIAEQKARIDSLVEQLEQLGVQPGI